MSGGGRGRHGEERKSQREDDENVKSTARDYPSERGKKKKDEEFRQISSLVSEKSQTRESLEGKRNLKD